MARKHQRVKVPIRGQLKLSGARYYDRRFTIDRKKRFHDAKTGQFISKKVMDMHVRANYGAMNLKGKYGRAADTISEKFGWSREESRAGMRGFLKANGDAIRKGKDTYMLYEFLRAFARTLGE